METVLDLLGVDKTFRDFWGRLRIRALSGIDLSLRRGEITALLGRNGAGKSTLMQICLGLLKPTSGRVLVFGASPREKRIKRRIGYLPEESYLHGFLTARETLLFHAGLCGLPRDKAVERTDYLLELVKLQDAAERSVKEFSKGMSRRLCLAQALVGDPEFLFLDEPTSGLDPLGIQLIKKLLLKLKKLGRTIFLSSHILGEVEEVADAIVIIEGGKVVRSGSSSDLLAAETSEIRTGLLSSGQLSKLRSFLSCLNVEKFEVRRTRRSLEKYFLAAVLGKEEE